MGPTAISVSSERHWQSWVQEISEAMCCQQDSHFIQMMCICICTLIVFCSVHLHVNAFEHKPVVDQIKNDKIIIGSAH